MFAVLGSPYYVAPEVLRARPPQPHRPGLGMLSKEPCILTKEPYILLCSHRSPARSTATAEPIGVICSAKEALYFVKRNIHLSKEPHILWEEAFFLVKISLYSIKRAICHVKRTLSHIRTVRCCIKKALCSIKRALYSIKRSLYSIKRALYSIKRALYSINRALHSIKRALVCNTRALYYIKRALSSFQKSPTSTVWLHTVLGLLQSLSRSLSSNPYTLNPKPNALVVVIYYSTQSLTRSPVSHTCEWVMSHIWMIWHEWVLFHMWMSPTHSPLSHTCEWVLSHIKMIWHMNESYYIYDRVMFQIYKSRVVPRFLRTRPSQLLTPLPPSFSKIIFLQQFSCFPELGWLGTGFLLFAIIEYIVNSYFCYVCGRGIWLVGGGGGGRIWCYYFRNALLFLVCVRRGGDDIVNDRVLMCVNYFLPMMQMLHFFWGSEEWGCDRHVARLICRRDMTDSYVWHEWAGWGSVCGVWRIGIIVYNKKHVLHDIV